MLEDSYVSALVQHTLFEVLESLRKILSIVLGFLSFSSSQVLMSQWALKRKDWGEKIHVLFFVAKEWGDAGFDKLHLVDVVVTTLSGIAREII
jgi:hypothetical protein